MTFGENRNTFSFYLLTDIKKREQNKLSQFSDLKGIVQEISYRCVAMQLLKKGIRIPLTAKA
jgi:hypothetical protein